MVPTHPFLGYRLTYVIMFSPAYFAYHFILSVLCITAPEVYDCSFLSVVGLAVAKLYYSSFFTVDGGALIMFSSVMVESMLGDLSSGVVIKV